VSVVEPVYRCRLMGRYVPNDGPMQGVSMSRFVYLEGPLEGQAFSIRTTDAKRKNGVPMADGDEFELGAIKSS
jgi:hypothetical protein